MPGKVVFGAKQRKHSTVRNTSQPARRNRPLGFDALEDRSVPSAVSFLKVDAGTERNWQGVYGRDGATVAGTTPVDASYAQVTFSRSQARIWASNTTDPRAVQDPGGTGRIASYWQGFTYTLDINLTDGRQHQLALYALDWTRAGRSDQIVATDADTGAHLDTRALSDFGDGKYLVYNVAGHVKFTVTALSGSSALLSGVFFDPVTATSPPPASPPASPPVNSPTSPPAGTNVAPTPAIAGPSGTIPGNAITFTGSATDPSPADTAAGFTYAWNFGDGTTGSGPSVTHTYAAAGTYTLTLTATDKEGQVGTKSVTVAVFDPSASGVIVTPDWIYLPCAGCDKIPNFGGHPTLTAVRSGAWSDPVTWGGRLPGAGESVSIPNGVTITYDQVSDVKYTTVAVQSGGTLQFRTDVGTRMRVTNLLVMEGGTLTVGTAANPVAAGVKAEIIINDVPIDTTKDPSQYGNGLIALGTVTMHGAAISDSFVKLATEPKAGDTTLTLATPVSGWRAGDTLVLPDTRQPYPGITGNQLEQLTVAGVSADGLTIALSQALRYDHLGARDRNGAITFLPYVGDLARNVVVKSENPSGTRGYTMYTDRANVDIEYAQFSDLGRTTNNTLDSTTYDANGNVTHVGTNQIGRYPVHFHHLFGPTTPQPDGYQYTFVGNSVFSTLNPAVYKWGITIHDSHYGRVADNVVYNVAGAGIMTEEGNETGNVIEKNFVAQITGTGDRGDGRSFRPVPEYGFEGTGIWLRGGNNYVRDNVVADTTIYGYQIMPQNAGTLLAPAFQGADPDAPGQGVAMDPMKTPVLEFARNEAFGMNTGLDIWGVGADITVIYNIGQSVIKDYRAWNTYRGFFAYPMNNFLLDGWVIRGDSVAGQYLNSQGISFGDYLSANITINNADVQGMKYGIMLPIKQGDVRSTGTTPQTMVIENSYLANHINIYSSTLSAVTGGGVNLSPEVTVVRDVLFAKPGWTETADDPHRDIWMHYRLDNANPNVIQTDQMFVYNNNRVAGDNFRVYYREQAPTFVMPQTGSISGLVGSPDAGLTNQQNWDKYGIAVAGALLPSNAVARDGIDGMIVPM